MVGGRFVVHVVRSVEHPFQQIPHLNVPLPLVPVPRATLLCPAAPPLVLPPFPIPDPARLPLVFALPRPGAMLCLELAAEGGAEYLLAGLLLVGGFSTKDVSVVRNVASVSGGALRSRYGDSWV